MSLLPEIINPIVMNGGNKVFDFVVETGDCLITSYKRLDKIILAENRVAVKIDEEQSRKKITSVAMLREALEGIMASAMELLRRHTPCDPCNPYTSSDFRELKVELLVEQLMFDILFDKYLTDSERMTRFAYSEHMSKFLKKDEFVPLSYSHSLDENLKRCMANYHDRIMGSQLQQQLKDLGIKPGTFAQYYTPGMKKNIQKNKPKFVWDCLFYHSALNLTSRQYRRQLTRESRNYPYKEIVEDLREYNEFVNKLLPSEQESSKKYFDMSMDYYILELYKRIDFMFKLIEIMQKLKLREIAHEHFLVRRFVPLVLVPYVQDNELHFERQYIYYRPLFVIEEKLHEEIQKKDHFDYRHYDALLLRHQYVRAKTYELFRYHCEFISSDYKGIKDFLCKHYNMISYHKSTRIWDTIADKQGKGLDGETQRMVKEQINLFFSINEAFFWKSSD